jgi:hypothetical protein
MRSSGHLTACEPSPRSTQNNGKSIDEEPELVLTIQGKGVNVLAVISEDHVFLTKSDGVFSLGDTVKHFQLGF